jgi:4-amino-4-deoxy-L-arabinose transferase-like glycosyltransferase
VFFVACAAAATKLPHYIAPAYPPLALLTGRFLARWMSGEYTPPRWVMPAGLGGFAFTGLAVAVGLLLAGGVIPLPAAKMRTFPGLEHWAWAGVILIAAAGLAWWYLRKGNRPAVIGTLVVGAVLFVAPLAAFAPREVDARKAVKPLVIESGSRVLDREVRIASMDFHQPSITFYVGRRVERINTPEAAAEFLAFDIESYLFVTEPLYDEKVAPLVGSKCKKVATHYDFYRNCNVVVVTNR